MPIPRWIRTVVLAALVSVAPAVAQLAPVSVPQGLLRLDFGGRFDNWDQQFRDGIKRDAASEFRFSSVDGRFLPTLRVTETDLRRITGVQDITLSLGQTHSSMLVNAGAANIGLAYGITSRLTLFGNVPVVRVRVQNRFDLDSTSATAGFNPSDPTFGDPGQAEINATFLTQFDAALSALQSKLAAGDYDANPAQKAAAQQALARGTALQDDLTALFGSATFLPLAGSAAAGTLTTPVQALQSTLSGLGVSGFSGSFALPSRGLNQEEFEGFFTNPDGTYQTKTFTPGVLQTIGDVEVGAAYTLVDRWRRRGGVAFRTALVGTVRLRTGKPDLPNSYFDLGSGDGQPDVQGDLVTDFMVGGIGARITGRYVKQLSGRVERRVAPPDQPLAPASTQAFLEWNPGEIIEGSFEPFLRIGPTLALTAGVHYRSKAADAYTYAPNQAPIAGISADVLSLATKQNATSFSLGLSYSHDGRRKDGTFGMPMDASLRVEKVTASSLGRVDARETVSVLLRFYRKAF